MRGNYLAHLSEDGREQTITEHLQGTANLAAGFGRSFGGEDQARLCGLAHDIGKYSDAFQKRLHGSNDTVDHSTAGAFECCKINQPFAAFAVAGHHGGLPDGGTQMDMPEDATFLGRMKRGQRGDLPSYDAWRNEVSFPVTSPPSFAKEDPIQGMFFTRMLYSCLVDADFLDTESFMTQQQRDTNYASILQLQERLQQYIKGWFPPKGELNRQRCRILQNCIKEGGTRERGLFSLTVPTGGGKTVASLAFALEHAKNRGLERVIYVIPYTSIIEQTAEVFREILGEENVLEHHSNVLYDTEEYGELGIHNIRMVKATENWDMPVIVTTAVQFFESLYACRSAQCRKLHHIANSVIIFDEAQMIPLSYLRPCISAISQLVKEYRASAVLCTATQPALASIFEEILPGYTMEEICPEEIYQQEVFRRVRFLRKGTLGWEELGEHLNREKQVLCIVNTRKNAQEIWEHLEEEGRFHLSTLMCPLHRRQQLKEIRKRLREGMPCRTVSTSLIEAGVDVDFPLVFREEAGLDSILQAAGRCNREGKRSAEESVVAVFRSEGNTPPLFSTSIGAARIVMEQYEDFSCHDAIHDYFSQLYGLKGSEAQDVKGVISLIKTECFPFRKVAERFRLIESPTVTIYIPYKEGSDLIQRLREGERSRRLLRQLGQYGVSVYENHFAALKASGDLELLEDGIAVLWNEALYTEETGLSLSADSGKCLFI